MISAKNPYIEIHKERRRESVIRSSSCSGERISAHAGDGESEAVLIIFWTT
jgi:hypothetical protein